MKCKKVHDDLIFYAEGSLPEERRAIIEAHLSECTECGKFLSLIINTLGLIESERKITANPFLYTRISARLQDKEKYSSGKVAKLIPYLIGVTMLVAGTIGGIMLGQLSSGPLPAHSVILGEEIRYLDEIKQESIESFLFTLNDGGYE